MPPRVMMTDEPPNSDLRTKALALRARREEAAAAAISRTQAIEKAAKEKADRVVAEWTMIAAEYKKAVDLVNFELGGTGTDVVLRAPSNPPHLIGTLSLSPIFEGGGSEGRYHRVEMTKDGLVKFRESYGPTSGMKEFDKPGTDLDAKWINDRLREFLDKALS